MLSESQERMLIIVRKGHRGNGPPHFREMGLPAAEIGFVTDDGFMRVKDHGRVVSEIPAKKLADEAPLYEREAREPHDLAERRHFDFSRLTEPDDLQADAAQPRGLAEPRFAAAGLSAVRSHVRSGRWFVPAATRR